MTSSLSPHLATLDITYKLVSIPPALLASRLDDFAHALHTGLHWVPLVAVVQPLESHATIMCIITRHVRALLGPAVMFHTHQPIWAALLACVDGNEREADALADALTQCLEASIPPLRRTRAGGFSWRSGTMTQLVLSVAQLQPAHAQQHSTPDAHVMTALVNTVAQLAGPDVLFSTTQPLAAHVLRHCPLDTVAAALRGALGVPQLVVTPSHSLMQLAVQAKELTAGASVAVGVAVGGQQEEEHAHQMEDMLRMVQVWRSVCTHAYWGGTWCVCMQQHYTPHRHQHATPPPTHRVLYSS